MDGPGDVPKQRAHRVGREARRGLGLGRRRRRSLLGAAFDEDFRELAELGFGDVELEIVQLLVHRADLLAVLGYWAANMSSSRLIRSTWAARSASTASSSATRARSRSRSSAGCARRTSVVICA